MRSSPLRTAAVLLSAFAALAASAPAQAPVVRPAPPALLAQFDVHAGTVQALDLIPDATGGYSVQVQLGADLRTLSLHLHEVRAPSFQLLVVDANGAQVAPTPPCVTYRGQLLEEPTAKVAASIVDGSLTAVVYRPAAAAGAPGEDWVVQPVRQVAPTAGPAAHVVFRSEDSTPLPYVCGNDDPPPPPGPAFGVDVTLACEIAIEADVEYYNLNNNSVVDTQNDITSVMNQVEFIYERDCDITYDITTIVVTTTPVYTTNDHGPLLTEFRNNWNANYASVQRDITHLFTGRNLTGSVIGVAQLSTICNPGYGLSQARFSTNLNSRTGLVCHELGHNWSAPHCDAVSPCYIMCSGLGGCGGNVTAFGPTEIGQITSYAATRTCLSIQPVTPVISGVSPNSFTVFQPGNVNLTGSGFNSVTSFSIGAQTWSSGFFVTNDGAMSITLPEGLGLGLMSLRVHNALGTSNQWPIVVTATSPPKLRVTPIIFGAGGVATWDFAGVPGRPWFLVFSIFNVTQPFQGFDLLEPFLLLTTGVFPAPDGVSSLSVPVPGGLGLLNIYSQVLEADASSPTATGVSNIPLMILL